MQYLLPLQQQKGLFCVYKHDHNPTHYIPKKRAEVCPFIRPFLGLFSLSPPPTIHPFFPCILDDPLEESGDQII